MVDTVTAPGAGSVLGFDLVTLPDSTPNVLVARTKVGFGVDGSYADVTPTVGLPVAFTPATHTDRSGTITTASTVQNVMSANAARKYAGFQNNSAYDMRINAKAAASSTAGYLIPGGKNALYEYPAHATPTTAISVWCGTAGAAYEASEA